MLEKLQSRKLWASVFAVVSSIVFIFTGNELDEGVTTQLTELAPSIIALVYVFVQGIVDSFEQKSLAQVNAAQLAVALGQTQAQLQEATNFINTNAPQRPDENVEAYL